MTNIPEVFYVVADHGRIGRESIINWERCSRADVIDDLIRGEHTRPLEVHCIDREAGRWEDCSLDIADAILLQLSEEPAGALLDFLEQHLGCEQVAEFCRELVAA